MKKLPTRKSRLYLFVIWCIQKSQRLAGLRCCNMKHGCYEDWSSQEWMATTVGFFMVRALFNLAYQHLQWFRSSLSGPKVSVQAFEQEDSVTSYINPFYSLKRLFLPAGHGKRPFLKGSGHSSLCSCW